jgi:hypothetical protein
MIGLGHRASIPNKKREHSARVLDWLPRQGSNLDSSDPESDVLPITPQGSVGAPSFGASFAVRRKSPQSRRACGAKGNRTPDLLNAIQALSQLSYSPENVHKYTGFRSNVKARRRRASKIRCALYPPRVMRTLKVFITSNGNGMTDNGNGAPSHERTIKELREELDELRNWKANVEKFIQDQNQVNKAFSKAIAAFGDFTQIIQQKVLKPSQAKAPDAKQDDEAPNDDNGKPAE